MGTKTELPLRPSRCKKQPCRQTPSTMSYFSRALPEVTPRGHPRCGEDARRSDLDRVVEDVLAVQMQPFADVQVTVVRDPQRLPDREVSLRQYPHRIGRIPSDVRSASTRGDVANAPSRVIA